ncbi:hypothetical protein ACLOJK_019591 [Asimina triloba]
MGRELLIGLDDAGWGVSDGFVMGGWDETAGSCHGQIWLEGASNGLREEVGRGASWPWAMEPGRWIYHGHRDLAMVAW